MTGPLIVRQGEGRSVTIGPDRMLVRIGGKDTDDRFDLIEGTVSYLAGPPLHLHYDQDDTILVVRGRLKVRVGDQLADLVPGDLISAPPGVPHTFTNLEREPAHFINVMTPGSFDRTLEEFSALLGSQPDPEALAEFAERHRIALVGPPLADELGLT